MESLGSTIVYWIIALSIVIFSILTVTTRRILRTATYLLFTLFAAALLYFKLDYEFLGAVQIAVYAGGIVVLFVFSILLTSHPGDNSRQIDSGRKWLGGIAAVLLLVVCGAVLLGRCSWACTQLTDTANPTMQTIGKAMMSTSAGGYLLPFEAISVLLLACIIGGVVVARKR